MFQEASGVNCCMPLWLILGHSLKFISKPEYHWLSKIARLGVHTAWLCDGRTECLSYSSLALTLHPQAHTALGYLLKMELLCRNVNVSFSSFLFPHHYCLFHWR